MYPSELIPNSGLWARTSYYNSDRRQWIKVGTWHRMVNPAGVWAQGLQQHKLIGHDRDVWVDVMPSKGGRNVQPLYSIQVKKHLGLGQTPEPTTPTTTPTTTATASTPTTPPAMSTTAFTQADSLPGQAPAYISPSRITMAHPGYDNGIPATAPATAAEWQHFMMQQQNQTLQNANLRVYELQQQLIQADLSKGELQRKVDSLELDLRHKDREHEHKLIEARREIRDEFEDREPKPSGLNGLAEAVTNPQHPLAGLVGLFAAKMLGASPTAGGGAADDGTMGGHTKNMTDILNGIAELIPTDEYGAKLYDALTKILGHPEGLDTLIQLGNQAAPQLA